MTKLAYLIALEEGFFKSGSLPQRRHNPGDLRHSPHASHEGIDRNGIGIIGTDDEGWADMERQLRLDADRGMTLRDLVYKYAPPNENDSAKYLSDLCLELGCEETTPVSAALCMEVI